MPANLSPKDAPLFSNSKKATFYVLPSLIVENALVLQDTVFSYQKRKFLPDYTHVEGLGVLPLAKRLVNCSIKKWRTIAHGIWIKDHWSANYFHWFSDCIPRIIEGLKKGISNQVILPESFKKLSYVVESLKILGAEAAYYHSKENLLVKNLVLTSRTATFPNFDEEIIQQSRERLSTKSDSAPFKKVYISRKFAEKRKTHNVTEVEMLVKKYGFEVVYAEKMSLKKMIKLMSETKTLLCLHGAGMTNMLFMPENQTVIELRNINDKVTQCYFNMASALHQNYYYTLNKGDSSNTIMTNFTIDLDALEQVLKSLEE